MRLSLLLLGIATATLAAADGVTVGQWNGMLLVTAPVGGGLGGLGPRAAQRITLNAQDQPITETLDILRTSTKLNIIVAPAIQAKPPAITLQVADMALGNVLHWIESIAPVHIAYLNDALYVSDQPIAEATSTRLYDVRDLSTRVPNFPGPSLSLPEPGGTGSLMLAPIAEEEAPRVGIDEIQHLVERFVAQK